MKFRLISATLLICSFSFAQQNPNAAEAALKFSEVLSQVDRMYVDDVNADKLTNTAIVALLEELDPHSTLISKEEVDDANERINGNFVGIGIRFQILKDTLMVANNSRWTFGKNRAPRRR